MNSHSSGGHSHHRASVKRLIDTGQRIGQQSYERHCGKAFYPHRFAAYKEKVIDLLARVTTVSVETQRIVAAMKKTVH